MTQISKEHITFLFRDGSHETVKAYTHTLAVNKASRPKAEVMTACWAYGKFDELGLHFDPKRKDWVNRP